MTSPFFVLSILWCHLMLFSSKFNLIQYVVLTESALKLCLIGYANVDPRKKTLTSQQLQ